MEWIDENGGKKKSRNCISINNKFGNNVGKRWIFSEEEGDDYGRKNWIEADAPTRKDRDGLQKVATRLHSRRTMIQGVNWTGETRGEGSTTIQRNFHGICTRRVQETEDG